MGGTVQYPTSGSPIATGTSLTVQRILPLQQLTTISNQGDFSPQVIEQALDTLCMEIQQVSARSGQYRGVWQTGIVYNYGDLVTDGVNGTNSNNIYICVLANTSGTWSTDLSAGDWSLAIQSTMPAASLPLAIANGGTGQTTGPAALTALGGISLAGTNTYTGANNFTGGSITVPTAGAGDNSTKAASTAFVTTSFAAPPSIGNTTPGSGAFTTLNSTGGLYVAQAGSTQAYFGSTGSNASFVKIDNATASQQSAVKLQDAGVDKWALLKETDNTFKLQDLVASATFLKATTSGALLLGAAQGTSIAQSGAVSIAAPSSGNNTLTVYAVAASTSIIGSFAGTVSNSFTSLDTTAGTASQTHLYFSRNGSVVGSVTATNTTTAYNTSSDARLKTVTGPITNSSAIIDALNPVNFLWKYQGNQADVGFIAQDVSLIVPSAVHEGDSDPNNTPDNPTFKQWQGDWSKIIPFMVAEIKSLRARIAVLEAK